MWVLCEEHFVNGQPSLTKTEVDYVPTIFDGLASIKADPLRSGSSPEDETSNDDLTLSSDLFETAEVLIKMEEEATTAPFESNSPPSRVAEEPRFEAFTMECSVTADGSVATQANINCLEFPDLGSSTQGSQVLLEIALLKIKLSERKLLTDEESQTLFGFKFLTFEYFVHLLDVPFSQHATKPMNCALFFIKMRHNVPFCALSRIFDLEAGQTLNLYIGALNSVHKLATAWIWWIPKDMAKDKSPVEFKRLYPACRVILDSIEIACEAEKSQDLSVLIDVNRNPHGFKVDLFEFTVKILIGVTPNGIISFVSAPSTKVCVDSLSCPGRTLLSLMSTGDQMLSRAGCLWNPHGMVNELPSKVNPSADSAMTVLKDFRILEQLDVVLFPHIQKILLSTCLIVNSMSL
eukprot:maker-scaffold1209_size55568-snap-gene-0.12 protein:Tk03742 transcript:maker-scaffold1209_size55568-snap-gene-0.12-mRNA-1 annotation:"conserved hypothetical protein"